MNDETPAIEIEADGPYVVVGGPTLHRGARVQTVYGEPVDWEVGPPLPTGGSYRLCRCGGSSTKPFCDDTHERVGFDGTEVADRGPRAARARMFRGEGVVMTDDLSLCIRAGFCGDRFTNVWAMIGETGDPAIRARLQRMVSLCPSGRLDHRPDEDAEPVEPAFEPSIVVERDGPLWVRGWISVRSASGTIWEVRNRVTLCRCGRSRNKPFCDGSHEDVGFRDG